MIENVVNHETLRSCALSILSFRFFFCFFSFSDPVSWSLSYVLTSSSPPVVISFKLIFALVGYSTSLSSSNVVLKFSFISCYLFGNERMKGPRIYTQNDFSASLPGTSWSLVTFFHKLIQFRAQCGLLRSSPLLPVDNRSIFIFCNTNSDLLSDQQTRSSGWCLGWAPSWIGMQTSQICRHSWDQEVHFHGFKNNFPRC